MATFLPENASHEMTPPALVAKFARGLGGAAQQIEIASARHLEQGWADEQKKSDHRRDGIAGETEDETRLRAAEHERLARLDRHLPKLHRSEEHTSELQSHSFISY